VIEFAIREGVLSLIDNPDKSNRVILRGGVKVGKQRNRLAEGGGNGS